MATPSNASKPVAPKPLAAPKAKRVRRFQVTHGPSGSTYTFVGQSHFTVGGLLPAIETKLAQVGLDSLFRGKTHAQAREIVRTLEAGKWIKAAQAPKPLNVLSEAMANIAKRRGKGLHTEEQFAKLCDAKLWEARLFGVDGKGGMTKAARNDLRAEDEVRAEVAAVKLARAKAAPSKEAGPSALDKALS